MNYTIETLKYICKNFLYVVVFAFIPALFFSFTISESAVTSVLTNVFSGNPKESFWNIFQTVSIFNFSSWESVVFGFIGVIACVFCVAMLTAFLEKHMRIGKRTLNGLVGKVNDNLISTCGFILLCLTVYEIWSVLLSALCYFVMQIPSVIIAYVSLGIIYIAMHAVLLYVLSIFYLWLPCMQITGFKAFEALRYSYQLVAPIQTKLVVGQVAFLLLCEALIGATVVLISGSIASFVAATILYATMILIYCIRMLVVYFDRAQIERADLKRYYH